MNHDITGNYQYFVTTVLSYLNPSKLLVAKRSILIDAESFWWWWWCLVVSGGGVWWCPTHLTTHKDSASITKYCYFVFMAYLISPHNSLRNSPHDSIKWNTYNEMLTFYYYVTINGTSELTSELTSEFTKTAQV